MSDVAAAARRALDAAGQLSDEELDLAGVALQFARIDRPDLDWPAACGFLSRLVGEAVQAVAAAGGDPAAAIAAIGDVMHARHGFAGDRDHYDDPDNANLLAVLQRRRGLPVALGLLWLQLGEAAGLPCHGLDIPGHFLIAFGASGGRAVCDPFDGGRVVTVERPSAPRPGPLLPPPMAKRAVLLRLQNNLKVRRLNSGDASQALACLHDMLRLAPAAGNLWLEAALLEEQAGAHAAALASLDRLLALPQAAEPSAALAVQARALRRRITQRRAALRGDDNRPS